MNSDEQAQGRSATHTCEPCLAQLLGCFHTAQTNAAARRREAAGASLLDDKAQRKHEWTKLGVPASLLVPTLLTCKLQLAEP